MATKQSKVRNYRKPLNLNIGVVIFIVIFLYVAFCVVMSFQTTHIVRYEVKKGSIATNNIYRGIAIRKETVVDATRTGYINYMTYEGERIAKGDNVYAIDETGKLSEQIQESLADSNSLTEKELLTLRTELVNYMHGFREEQFNSIYEFKYSLQNTLLKLANNNMIAKIDGGIKGVGEITKEKAPATGIVTFWTDGYEALTAEGVNEACFAEKDYKKNTLLNNAILEAGDAAYKISTDENWSIVLPMDAAYAQELEKLEYIKVKFRKNQYESWGKAKALHNGDGNTYLQLSFTNSMITFVGDRYIDVELIIHDEEGLKIPRTSIVEKEFYLIPERFLLDSSVQGKCNYMKQVYDENGNPGTELITTDVYSYDKETGEYYVDAALLNAGDVLRKAEGQETFTVSKRATLIGVFNMNKGYADFKQISILYENEEYAIVKANTQYGLNVYDYIVLDAETVKDDQFIVE